MDDIPVDLASMFFELPPLPPEVFDQLGGSSAINEQSRVLTYLLSRMNHEEANHGLSFGYCEVTQVRLDGPSRDFYGRTKLPSNAKS